MSRPLGGALGVVPSSSLLGLGPSVDSASTLGSTRWVEPRCFPDLGQAAF